MVKISRVNALASKVQIKNAQRIKLIVVLMIVFACTVVINGGDEEVHESSAGSVLKHKPINTRNGNSGDDSTNEIGEDMNTVLDKRDVSLRNEYTDRCVTVTSPIMGGRRCNVHPCTDLPSPSSLKEEEELKSYVQNRGFAIRSSEKFENIRGPTMQLGGHAKDGSGCVISQKYKFFFIHNLKVGGITTKIFLKRALCPGSSEPQKGIFRCSAGEDTLKLVDCKSGLQEAFQQSYFVFSFVRNPFSRLFSGYAMAESMANQRNNAKKEKDIFKNSTIVDGSTRRGNRITINKRTQLQRKKKRMSKYYSPFTFRDFAMASQAQRQRMSPTSSTHYNSQAIFLTDKYGCPVFDYIGHLEQYEDELYRIIHEIERRYKPSHERSGKDSIDSNPLMVEFKKSLQANSGRVAAFDGTSFGTKKKNSGNYMMDSVYSEVEVAEKVYNEYKIDFDLFGYTADFNAS